MFTFYVFDLPDRPDITLMLDWASYTKLFTYLPLVEFMGTVFTRMSCDSYRRRFGLCFRVCATSFEMLINSRLIVDLKILRSF